MTINIQQNQCIMLFLACGDHKASCWSRSIFEAALLFFDFEEPEGQKKLILETKKEVLLCEFNINFLNTDLEDLSDFSKHQEAFGKKTKTTDKESYVCLVRKSGLSEKITNTSVTDGYGRFFSFFKNRKIEYKSLKTHQKGRFRGIWARAVAEHM